MTCLGHKKPPNHSARNAFKRSHGSNKAKTGTPNFGLILALLKAKVLTHMGNGQKSSPFELYGRSDNVYETYLFSRNFSNLNKIFKTQKGKPIIGQKLPNMMPFQMVPCMGAYLEFHH